MAKLTTKLLNVDIKLFTTNEGLKKFHALEEEIKNKITIDDKIDAEEVKQLIVNWKQQVETRILTPLEIQKKESHSLYKADQQLHKNAKDRLDIIKQTLTDKFNEYAMPIIEQEKEQHDIDTKDDARITKAEKSINTTGLRKQPDKYVMHIKDATMIPDEYVIISYNENAIIEHFKDTNETIPGVEIEVIKGQYK